MAKVMFWGKFIALSANIRQEKLYINELSIQLREHGRDH